MPLRKLSPEAKREFALSIYREAARIHLKHPIIDERKVIVGGLNNVVDSDTIIKYSHRDVPIAEAFLVEAPEVIDKKEWLYVFDFSVSGVFDDMVRKLITPEALVEQYAFPRCTRNEFHYLQPEQFELRRGRGTIPKNLPESSLQLEILGENY